MTTPQLVVLGAGLQGICVALGLAHRGHRVTLIERQPQPMQAASRRNEGKIHLGFVYALDDSGQTLRRMLEGALSFGPLLDTWCGPLPWEAWRSEGFRYAVMPDSLVNAAELEEAYEQIRSLLPEVVAANPAEPRYVGRTLDWLWRHTDNRRGRPLIDGNPVVTLMETEEVSVDPRVLSDTLARVVAAHPLVELRCRTTVHGAERLGDGFRLHLEDMRGMSEVDAGAVVNCTWEDRKRLDRTVAVGAADPGDSYRVKYQILVRPTGNTARLAPVTMVQGPYGDVVPWGDGLVYISWYPESRTYFGDSPPRDGLDDPRHAAEVATRSLDAIAGFFPDLRGAEIISSLPGIIIAQGATDIDDRHSGLHKRASFGIQEIDGWWSVDTGKLTTAPLIGERASAIVSEAMSYEVA